MVGCCHRCVDAQSVGTQPTARGGYTVGGGCISFLVGTVCLALLTWATVGTVGFDLGNVVTQPWWIWSGGVFGVIGMTTNVLLLPVIGALYSTMLNLTAQVITTMIIDHLGLLGVDHYPADGWRITGAVLVMVAAALAVIGGRRRPQLNAQPTSKTWYLAGLGMGLFCRKWC